MRCKSESDWDGGRGVAVAARDRIITFGKYKGKMLGSVPSRYLKWVSNNLRAGHFEEWAKLADQVLQDPIYRDRIEWELALNVLNGNNLNLNLSLSSSSAVSQLLDISDRFGWDNHDKVGWSKVNFDLLGTSKGGRIPRRLVTHTLTQTDTHTHAQLQHKDPHPPTSTCLSITLNNNESRTRRMQRRERQKNIRLKTQAEALHQHTENNKKNVNDINMDYHDDDDDDGRMVRQDQNQNAIANPFPGRQALLTNYHRIHTHRHTHKHKI